MHESESEVAQSCPTLSDYMDCSLPGTSVHGILQARVLDWVAISFSNKPLKNMPNQKYVPPAKAPGQANRSLSQKDQKCVLVYPPCSAIGVVVFQEMNLQVQSHETQEHKSSWPLKPGDPPSGSCKNWVTRYKNGAADMYRSS